MRSVVAHIRNVVTNPGVNIKLNEKDLLKARLSVRYTLIKAFTLYVYIQHIQKRKICNIFWNFAYSNPTLVYHKPKIKIDMKCMHIYLRAMHTFGPNFILYSNICCRTIHLSIPTKIFSLPLLCSRSLQHIYSFPKYTKNIQNFYQCYNRIGSLVFGKGFVINQIQYACINI